MAGEGGGGGWGDFTLAPWSEVFPSSLVDFPLNFYRIGRGRSFGRGLFSTVASCQIPDEHWLPVVKGPFDTTSLSVIKYCLLFLAPLVSFFVKVIIWVFGLQCASAAWECCLGFTSKP